MEKKNPIEEARRYVANAKETIAKADLNTTTGYYQDRKYIQTAGDLLWKGCLIALDAAFGISAKLKKDQRADIDDYKKAVAKRDRKLSQFVNDGYKAMHLNMGYDGVYNKAACDDGFRIANLIIDRCATLLK